MTWYIIIFVLCLAGFILNNYFVKDNRAKTIIDILLIIVLCFATGTRYNIGGYDYSVYEYIYKSVPKLGNFNIFSISSNQALFGMENGYLFLCSLFKTLGFTYYGFTMICSIIFYTSMYRGLKKYTKNFTFLIIVFLYKLFIFQTFVLTRQMLCLGGFFLLLKYIKDGKFWRYLIGCLILSTIHTTALILIPIYFIRHFKLSKKRLIVLTLIFTPTIIFSLLDISVLGWLSNILSSLLGSKISTYIKYLNTSSPINILNTIEYLGLMMWIIYRYDDLVLSEDNKFWIKLFLILLPIFTLLRGYEILARIKDYFVIVYAFIVEALLLLKTKKFKISKNVIYFALIGFCFVAYIRYIKNFGDGCLIPYNSYINDNVKIIDFKE